MTTQQPEKYFLLSSAIYAERKPTIVQTVLGSCVAVCLFDKVKDFGGINHYMMPVWKGEGLASPKYGNIAIEKLLKRMLNLGAKKENLIAKIFGGASQYGENTNFSIAKNNIQVAKDVLQEHKIPIIASNVGGEKGRRILFNTNTGEVLLKYVVKH
ncbi:chemotaxis protein CheD [Fulvivirga sediminis]|uniref:Probable chemoreceptor glutamine deamidase CheD n=1 Tax=Fulvivirga sediminis TaxID=2803949 RepID=A0A937K0Q9_9BACT|nr:chemotaxis protein CheD [Fulvivirga sediminis]MBL3658598.1 chemotaxis protein CheD [Fulvivirga sediminis]